MRRKDDWGFWAVGETGHLWLAFDEGSKLEVTGWEYYGVWGHSRQLDRRRVRLHRRSTSVGILAFKPVCPDEALCQMSAWRQSLGKSHETLPRHPCINLSR